MSTEECTHYKRKCKFKSPCCEKIYPCRLCHDDKENHQLDRQAVKQLVCSQCSQLQTVSTNCSSCGILFGNYNCLTCNLFDDTPRGQFHCSKCGICRVGGHEKFFHCDRCDMCLAISIKSSHKCVEKTSRRNCPICLEDLHTSRVQAHVPDCGHLLHRKCFDNLLKNGCYTCPTCNECLVDMKSVWKDLDREIEETPMPPEFREMKVCILCRDCHKTSDVLFHIVGLKCSHCGSYNTSRNGNEDLSDELRQRRLLSPNNPEDGVEGELLEDDDDDGDDDDDLDAASDTIEDANDIDEEQEELELMHYHLQQQNQ